MKPIRYKILGYLQIFVGMGAISGGLPMILSPDGSSMGMGLELLEKSPFTSYLIPGLILVAINGAGQLTGAYFSLKLLKPVATLGIVFGAALVVWTLVQIYYLGYSSWMQALFLAIGTVELFLALGIYKKTSLQKSK
jgi:hypothetical protein